MKHWEEAALLTDVLDRHAAHLVQGFSSADWTLFYHVERFLILLRSEPVLLHLVNEFIEEATTALNPLAEGMKAVLLRAERTVGTLSGSGDFEGIEAIDRTMQLTGVSTALRYAQKVPNDTQKGEQALGSLLQKILQWPPTSEQKALVRDCEQWQAEYRALASRFERHSANQPGVAYLRLDAGVARSEFATDGLPDELKTWNEHAAKLQANIRRSSLWRGMGPAMAQPQVTEIHDSVRILHLALVTSLARGRSRWATVKRFAGRCESLDRERLRFGLNEAKGKAEGYLTLEFARYLFDAGYNPLVDAKTCGLRPDVLDVTSQPAIYVEAKQYEKVGDGTPSQLEKGLAQTLSTWRRLSKRWHVPEAFLLVFRRSGRPLEFENSELRVSGGRLYVLCVDLGDAAESGSRAEVPVRVDLANLLARDEEGMADGQ